MRYSYLVSSNPSGMDLARAAKLAGFFLENDLMVRRAMTFGQM